MCFLFAYVPICGSFLLIVNAVESIPAPKLNRHLVFGSRQGWRELLRKNVLSRIVHTIFQHRVQTDAQFFAFGPLEIDIHSFFCYNEHKVFVLLN